jgi:hypothetical protein
MIGRVRLILDLGYAMEMLRRVRVKACSGRFVLMMNGVEEDFMSSCDR